MRFGHVLWAVLGLAVAFASGASSVTSTAVLAQSLPNPYRMVEGWAQLPNGRQMGAVGKVAIDPDGRHIWAIVRCDPLADPARFGDECRDSKTDAVYKFSPDGKVVTSFAGGMFIWPHGIEVDREGNVWVTDAVAANRTPRGDKRGDLYAVARVFVPTRPTAEERAAYENLRRLATAPADRPATP